MRKLPPTRGGLRVLALACCCSLALTTALRAATFYADPVNGSMSGDGSVSNPWGSLADIFAANLIESQKPQNYPYTAGAPLVPRNSGAPVKAGDTILLLSGDHGNISLLGWYNSGMITIEGAPGETPVLQGWVIKGGKNWTVRGVTISKEPYSTPNSALLFSFEGHSWHGPASHSVVEDCYIYTVDDTSAWSATDWTSTSASGIKLAGEYLTARGNTLKNVRFGISSSGDHALVEHNQVINFAGDGLRGLGSYSTFQYNFVKNCYNVDGNHDDGFQSWSDGGSGSGSGTVYGMVLRGNVILQTDDFTRPHQGSLQGIGCFDGFFEDWVVENNVIIVEAYHALSLYGAINCTIANNTIVEIQSGATPWLGIFAHKTRGPSTGNTVVNNISTKFSISSGSTSTYTNNLTVPLANYASYFTDAANLDFSLVNGSPAIDAGTSTSAPAEDIDGNPRPLGSGYDVGAYEFVPAIQLNGLGNDLQVHNDGTATWVGNQSTRVGGATSTLEGAMVYVFQLPALPSGQTVVGASLDFTLLNHGYAPAEGNADLHALPYRSSPTVLPANDFYHGPFSGDANATPIQDDIMVNTEPVGRISTDATGQANLADYLAAQYSAGAQAGDYVFLRINPDVLNVSGYKYWVVASANNSTVANRPVLNVLFGAP